MKKVAILYGFSEGPWQSKALRKHLKLANISTTKNVSEADIIIAHSGGCYMIPNDTKAKLVMLVGLPHWPGRNIMNSLLKKIRSEKKNWWWLKKSGFNIYYLLSRPKDWYAMKKHWQNKKLPVGDTATVIIAVRNQNDSFMHPETTEHLAKSSGWKLEILSGHHDDIWTNPIPYINLLKSYYA